MASSMSVPPLAHCQVRPDMLPSGSVRSSRHRDSNTRLGSGEGDRSGPHPTFTTVTFTSMRAAVAVSVGGHHSYLVHVVRVRISRHASKSGFCLESKYAIVDFKLAGVVSRQRPGGQSVRCSSGLSSLYVCRFVLCYRMSRPFSRSVAATTSLNVSSATPVTVRRFVHVGDGDVHRDRRHCCR